MNRHDNGRRTFLRGIGLHGLGVSLALPWLESTAVWGNESDRIPNQPPVRLAVLFSGNGFHSSEWWAKGAGDPLSLGQVLTPLVDFRDKMAEDGKLAGHFRTADDCG